MSHLPLTVTSFTNQCPRARRPERKGKAAKKLKPACPRSDRWGVSLRLFHLYLSFVPVSSLLSAYGQRELILIKNDSKFFTYLIFAGVN